MLNSKRKTIMLSSGQLSYRDEGEGDPILFLHGMNGNADSFYYQLDYFSDRYRAIAWDCPGYGRSDVVGGDVAAYASVALEFIERLGIEKTVVLGHSMGGIIATKLAIIAPTAVSKLILSSTFPGRGLDKSIPLPERYTRRIEEIDTLPREEYSRRRAEAMLPEGTGPDIIATIRSIASRMRKEGLTEAARMAAYADNTSFLTDIMCPTLVLTASKDQVIPYTLSAPFIENISNVLHHLIEGAGHAAYLEAPRQYNQVVSEFIESKLAR